MRVWVQINHQIQRSDFLRVIPVHFLHRYSIMHMWGFAEILTGYHFLFLWKESLIGIWDTHTDCTFLSQSQYIKVMFTFMKTGFEGLMSDSFCDSIFDCNIQGWPMFFGEASSELRKFAQLTILISPSVHLSQPFFFLFSHSWNLSLRTPHVCKL